MNPSRFSSVSGHASALSVVVRRLCLGLYRFFLGSGHQLSNLMEVCELCSSCALWRKVAEFGCEIGGGAESSLKVGPLCVDSDSFPSDIVVGGGIRWS